jgi:hypothetical protein
MERIGEVAIPLSAEFLCSYTGQSNSQQAKSFHIEMKKQRQLMAKQRDNRLNLHRNDRDCRTGELQTYVKPDRSLISGRAG